MNYQDIKMDEAIRGNRKVYMLLKLSPTHTIEDLQRADGFVVAASQTKKKVKTTTSKIDHGKIVALYTANPPRSVSWIADELGCSPQTVINHLTQEGIYKSKNEKE